MANTGRTYRAELTGGAAQAAEIARVDGCCRVVRSVAIEARQAGYRIARHSGRSYPAPGSSQLTELRKELEWLADAPVHALQQELRKLDRAYANFFAGRARYPKPRARRDGVSITFADRRDWVISQVAGKVWECKLPKTLGVVRFVKHRSFGGQVCSVTLSSKAGKWQLSFGVHQRKPARATIKPGDVCGVDLGVAVTAATSQPVDLGAGPSRYHRIPVLLSPGEQRHLLALERLKASQFEAYKRRCTKAKKDKADKPRVSRSYLDTCRRIAVIWAKAARRRKDWLRKLAHALGCFETVIFENLRITSMTASAKGTVAAPGCNVAQKSGLNRVILASGWGMLRVYTAEQTATVQVPAYRSSQECRNCGHACKENRPDQATFKCVNCGHTNNADLNASEILEARGRRVLAGEAPVAASASGRAQAKAPRNKKREGAGHATA